MLLAVALFVGLFLAYANGANDNFKGVATLLGSSTTNYRRALSWTSLCTCAGALLSIVVAQRLLVAFSGKGLVPQEVVDQPAFGLAVGLAAAATVLLATRLGLPISTTHALIGGLVGGGWMASQQGVDLGRLGQLMVPLASSPVLALVGTVILYRIARFARQRLGVTQETCICVGSKVVGVVPGVVGMEQALSSVSLPTVQVDQGVQCKIRYQGRVLGLNARGLLDAAHYLSSGVVCFARGLNDAPKIAALLLVAGSLPVEAAIATVGLGMLVGGWLGARRVAQTMAHRVTRMNPGQGFTANLVTGLLVVGASRMGLPVSTTHVSCGSLFGVGVASQGGRWRTIGQILLAWIITLPLAGVLSALAYQGLGRIL
jgi:PiT family inorganic phosphate transporter